MNIRFLPAAESELRQAVAHYERASSRLGARFLGEIVHCLRRIDRFPEAYPAFGVRARRCLLSGFPFAIIYNFNDEASEVLILAIAHLHRRPDYWTDRT